MDAPAVHLNAQALSGFGWHLPVSVRFGLSAANEAARDLQGRRVLVLTYNGSRVDPVVEQLSRVLADGLIDWIEVPDGLSTMALGRGMALRAWSTMQDHPDAVLLGLGGGSVMDIAKWIRLRPPNGHPAELDRLIESTAAPADWTRHELWLMPTTAGTGSEVTRWSTLWDTDAHPALKRSFDQSYGWADRAYVDPRLTRTCPPTVVRDSALDALGHALEVLWNRHRNPMSVSLARSAAIGVMTNLPKVLGDPDDVQLRAHLSMAALQAGLAFSQTRTALAHALSYPLTVEHGVPHGAAVAVWLPLVWRLACGHNTEIDASLSCVLGQPAKGGPVALQAWFDEIGFDFDLQGLGIVNVEQRVRAAMDHPRGRNFEGRWVDAEV